jgi:hypothetical protein
MLLGVAMMLAQARLVMDGIRWCGPGAAAAAERRKRARAQFYDPRYVVASLRNQHRFVILQMDANGGAGDQPVGGRYSLDSQRSR